MAIWEPCSEQSTTRPRRSSTGAKAIECSRKRSRRPQRSLTVSNTAPNSPGLPTSIGVMIGASTTRPRGRNYLAAPGDAQIIGAADRQPLVAAQGQLHGCRHAKSPDSRYGQVLIAHRLLKLSIRSTNQSCGSG